MYKKSKTISNDNNDNVNTTNNTDNKSLFEQDEKNFKDIDWN